MTRVVVVGSVNLDLAVAVPHLPVPGETILGSEVAFQPGGKGGNQAVAARRLGADTVLFAAVGADQFGDGLRTALAAEGLALDTLVTIEGAATGLAMIVVGDDGENTIVVAPGANAHLDNGRLVALADLLGPDAVLVLQLEIPLATCLAAARLARAAGATVVLNAAPLPSLPRPDLTELLSTVDILVVNEGEALSLIGNVTTLPDGPAGWKAIARDLCRLGPTTAIVTLGPRGAAGAAPEDTHWQPAFPVTPVDTTGAGDTFCGALAAALAERLPLPDAVRRGCAAGALATTRMGAQAAMPTTTELDAFLIANPDGGR